MIDPKDCTIIIPHLGESEESRYAIGECFQSLEETVPDIKKIIAYNGRKDNGEKGSLFSPADYINIKAQGQCKAVNAAVATTNTPWIFVTNDDMVYAPGWWEKLVGGELGIGLNPDVPTCISPQLVEPRQGAPTFIEYFCGGAGGDFDKQKWLEYVKEHGENQDIFKGIRTGFNLPFLIKRELWDTIGGYDINYDPWGSNSDSDLEYKIKLAGVQPYQNTNCLVYHFSQTSGTFEPRNQSHWQKNWDYFIEKWGFPRTDDGIWEATFEIPISKLKYRPEWINKYANS